MSRESRSLFLLAMLGLSACVVRVREPVEEVVAVEPPPEQHEVIGVAPSPNHFWIGGHWRWEGGRHVWFPGHWETRRHGYEWVAGHWRHEHHGYVWVEGRWARL